MTETQALSHQEQIDALRQQFLRDWAKQDEQFHQTGKPSNHGAMIAAWKDLRAAAR
jgi:hypothetical protein